MQQWVQRESAVAVTSDRLPLETLGLHVDIVEVRGSSPLSSIRPLGTAWQDDVNPCKTGVSSFVGQGDCESLPGDVSPFCIRKRRLLFEGHGVMLIRRLELELTGYRPMVLTLLRCHARQSVGIRDVLQEFPRSGDRGYLK